MHMLKEGFLWAIEVLGKLHDLLEETEYPGLNTTVD